jgi:hypothetical protein
MDSILGPPSHQVTNCESHGSLQFKQSLNPRTFLATTIGKSLCLRVYQTKISCSFQLIYSVDTSPIILRRYAPMAECDVSLYRNTGWFQDPYLQVTVVMDLLERSFAVPLVMDLLQRPVHGYCYLTIVWWVQEAATNLPTIRYDAPSLRLDVATETWAEVVWPSPSHNAGRVNGVSVVV